ncbi:gamma-glutamyltransferase family protein [Acetobacter sp. AN02]|uniref:gamma-glutamyltransferase n=1 Tax=Acetobacter sp. AN02 TaxID=2894186 RepID=UPI0024344218|nr:gamma-glutamyltransferase [Acetobacter sp. AN02]MDG6094596.1 gamma-glutamyltransferase family protein [Acetobacter sp. AN02]
MRQPKKCSVTSRHGTASETRLLPQLLVRAALAGTLSTSLAACDLFSSSQDQGSGTSLFGSNGHRAAGYTGEVVADEPAAALAARNVLSQGGNAADAAAALGIALAVTLPSRASLGSGGACLAWKPGDTEGQAFLFLPVSAGASPAASGARSGKAAAPVSSAADRPASVPMLARGLFLMQLRYGSVDFADTIVPALRLASTGTEVSARLAADLKTVEGPLLADDEARSIFARPDGSAMQAGDILHQRHLAGTLERMRSAGVGDLYTGALAQILISSAGASGSGIDINRLRSSVPAQARPLTLRSGAYDISFLPPPADGGLGTAVAFRALNNGGRDNGQTARRIVAAWRSGHGSDPQAILNSSASAPSAPALPALPASTSFAVADSKGGAVACALTMNNLFGTGRVSGSTGIVLGASPERKPLPLLTAAIAHHGRDSFRAAVTASGQNDAADAAAQALADIAGGRHPSSRHTSTPAGRVNALSCPQGLPGGQSSCYGWTDPAGGGYATGSSGK